ncbi:MAG: hypothetical protein AB1351_13910 [Thermoproteota archaeon]
MLQQQPFLIELWSDDDESSFAVKLSIDQEDSFRAIVTKNHDDRSSRDSKFTKIVDQMYYDESFHYDWPFMLERWIEAWKSGFRHSSLIVPEFPKYHRVGNNSSDKGILSFERKVDNNTTKRKVPSKKNSNNRRRRKWQKPRMKCHYCNLVFYDDIERSAHEEIWHANKLKPKSDSTTTPICDYRG